MTIAADARQAFPSRVRAAMRTQPVPTVEAARLIAKGVWARILFTWLLAILGGAALPLTFTLGYAALMTAWEFALRPALDRHFTIPLARRSERQGMWALAAISLVGGICYTVLPFAAWHTNSAVGVVFATAWICGAANHDFVYFSSHRLLLSAVIAPVAACALAAPFLTTGFTAISAAAVLTLAAMIIAAGFLGRDRLFLMEMISRQALARAEAEQANTAKSQFLAAMSHELRTPLNAIIGYAELIEEEPQEAAEDAGKIRSAARQLLSVINVILDLSRLEAGELTLKPERVAISEILEQVRESAAPLAAINGNAFRMTTSGELDEAELDHARLYQCVMQLIANAAKFTANGVIDLAVSREMRSEGEAIVFAVRDTGAGVPASQVERIFDPFVQADGTQGRRFEGAGLGLAFVRRVARLMGGDVICESELGRGSTFTLWAPVQRR